MKVEETVSSRSVMSEQQARVLNQQLSHVESRTECILVAQFNDLCGVATMSAQVNSATDDHFSFSQQVTDKVLQARGDILLLLPSSTATDRSTPVSTAGGIQYCHLPRLAELKFSGKIEDWPEFVRN